MNVKELKSELHQIIDQIEDNKLLAAIHTLLASQGPIVSYSVTGKPLTQNEVDTMLEASEADIAADQITNHEDLKEEMKTWRKQ